MVSDLSSNNNGWDKKQGGGNWPVCLNFNRSTLRDSVFVFLDVFTFKYSLYYMTINTSIGFVSKMHNDLPSFPDPPDILEHVPLGR